MTHGNSSSIAQFHFNAAPDVDLARIARDPDGAPTKCAPHSRRMSRDHEDKATLDIQGSRIVMSVGTGLPGQHAACLTISVGHGPAARKSSSLTQQQGTIRPLIADRLSTRFPAHQPRWHKGPSIVACKAIDTHETASTATLPTATPLDEVFKHLSAAIGTHFPDTGAAPLQDLRCRIVMSLRGSAMSVIMGLRMISAARNSGGAITA